MTPVKLSRRYYLIFFNGTWTSCVGKKIISLANKTSSASAESLEIKFNVEINVATKCKQKNGDFVETFKDLLRSGTILNFEK